MPCVQKALDSGNKWGTELASLPKKKRGEAKNFSWEQKGEGGAPIEGVVR